MIKKISVLFMMFLLLGVTFIICDEIDYKKLFHSAKDSLNPLDFSSLKSPMIKGNEEFADVLKGGINSFNVFAPYTQSEKNIKEVISKLTYIPFTLRSAESIDIYEKAAPATVLIIAQQADMIGAGFVIDNTKGLIATNFHVTSGLKDVLVTFYKEDIQDFSSLIYHTASVIRYSAKKDIAILKLKSMPETLKLLDMSYEISPKIGEDVYTIGHPLELPWTYSRGQISGLRKQFSFGEEQTADVIQIDASVSPGNSGGPLLDSQGRAIGMVTFGYLDERAQNLNFAVSCSEINALMQSGKDEDTDASTTLQKLLGSSLFSYEDVRKTCQAYEVDEDGDMKYDYISLVDIETKKEKYRYMKEFEAELEPGQVQKVNVLFMDLNEDGEMDVMYWDYEMDNIFDSIMLDINFDGILDIVGIDSEGSGSITEAWIM